MEADDVAPTHDIRYSALLAVLNRDASTLESIFQEDGFSPEFHFLDQPIPFSFTLHLQEGGKPRIGFGFDLGDKVATIYRLFQILPLLKQISRHPFDGQIVFNMGDEVGPHHIGFCSNTNAVLIPDCEFIGSSGYAHARATFDDLPSWEDRSSIPFWRGSSTGLPAPGAPMTSIPRAALCRIGQANGYDVAFSSIVQASEKEARELQPLVRDVRPWHELSFRKDNIDIDGNTSAWSALFLKLLSGGVVLKVGSMGNYRQWYYDMLHPWINFVPVAADMSDLTMVIDRLNSDSALACRIARKGRQLALRLTLESELAFAERAIMSEMLLQSE